MDTWDSTGEPPELWHTTITELIGLFRDALVDLIPSLERARIPWRNGEAYDEHDAIAQALYDAYVVSAIRWGLREHPDHYQNVRLPQWDFLIPSYGELDWIEVLPDGVAGRRLALVGLGTYETGDVQGDLIRLPFREMRFRFQWHQDHQGWEPVEQLAVYL